MCIAIMLADNLRASVRSTRVRCSPVDSNPPSVTEVVTNDKTPGGIRDHRWNTKPLVGYKVTGGIQDHRWDTKRPVGYKNPGGI
jgi:hypothetical protein